MTNIFDHSSSDADSDSSSTRRRRSERARALLEESRVELSTRPTYTTLVEQEDAEARHVSHESQDECKGNNDLATSDFGGIEEEDELRHMRATRAYGDYADEYQRDIAHQLKQQLEASQNVVVAGAAARTATAAAGDDGSSQSANSNCGHVDLDKEPSSDLFPTDYLGKSQPIGTLTGLEKDVKNHNTVGEFSRRARRPLDPKIIDDSSDDDTSDRSDTDDSDVAPAGPAPPPTVPSIDNSRLPLSHEARLGSRHDAHVSAISLDAAGSRFVTASADASLKLWDFGTMDSSLQSFRSVDPLQSGPIFSAQFSSTGGRILCAGNISVARILDRDGRPLVETVPGDMYLVDMARTKGHVAPLSAARWLRNDSHQFATIAGDATLRLWDMALATASASVFDGDIPRAKQVQVVKLRNIRGSKTNATALCCIPDKGNRNRLIIGCDDCSVKIIDPRTFSLRPATEISEAVSAGSEVTGMDYCEGDAAAGPLLLVRSTDNSLRVFDLRRVGEPVAYFDDLPNSVPQTDVSFMGTHSEWFITGTSANRRSDSDQARVSVYCTKTLHLVQECPVAKEVGSVIALSWHDRINQLLYGCSDGSIHAMYSPASSNAGVMRCLLKTEKRKQHSMIQIGVRDINVASASALHARGSHRGKRSLAGENSMASSAPSRGGNASLEPRRADILDESKMTGTFTKAFMKAKVKATWADEDPRQALLRHDTEARKNPKFTAAYKATQPNPVFAEKTLEQEDEESRLELEARNKRMRLVKESSATDKSGQT